MRSCDVLIVGGGPGGSSAAWQLRRAGADVLVLDRERFPRLKLCAGWITPEVVRDLEIDLEAYPHRLLTFPRLRVHWGRLQVPIPCVQHSIRRFEFDAWLLERSGAYWLVLCPDGRRGWLHKMTLGEIVDDTQPGTAGGGWGMPEPAGDILQSMLDARGRAS